MDGQGLGERRDALARALVAIQRYSMDITQIAAQSLGSQDIENIDIQLVLTVHRFGPIAPTEIAQRMAAPRSTLARSLNRLDRVGLTVRIPDEADRRSVRVCLTPRGRRRVTTFATRLGDYFAEGEPMLKSAFELLGITVPDPDPAAMADPIAAAEAMGAAGARYVDEAVQAWRPLGISEFSDRHTVTLLDLYGTQRPTQIADELGLTPSATSGVLSRLEHAGLVTRRHDLTPGDRRAVVVELTPRGTDAADMLLEVFARHADAVVHALALTWRTPS
jgi:DNA-binding MarR family transcriptional regulator